MNNKLNLDGRWDVKYHGSTVYARNKVFDKTIKALKTEDSFKPILNVNENIIGIKVTNYDIVIFSIGTLPNAPSTISYYNFATQTHTIVLRSAYLNFSTLNLIHSIAYYNFKNELIVNFIDGIKSDSNKIRSINLMKLPFKVDSNHELVNPDDITLLNIYPDLTIPDITLKEVTGDGILKSGSYVIFVSYIYYDLEETFWLNSTKSIPVYVDNISTGDNTSGSDSNLQTNKAITIVLDNIDDAVYKLKIGVVYTAQGVKSAYYRTFTKSSVVNITDLNSFATTSLDDITITPTIYTKAKAITAFKNRAIYGNLISEDELDIQKYVNNIELEWQKGENHTKGDYKEPNIIYEDRTFLPNEVYAIYLRVFRNDGSIAGDYHIPGRAYKTLPSFGAGVDERAKFVYGTTAGNYIDVNVHTDYKDDANLNAKYFQTRDTATLNTGGWNGEFSYWENTNERYTNDNNWQIWDVDGNGNGYNTNVSLANTPVRHHKFPSQSFLLANGLLDITNKGKLDLKVAIKSIKFPDDILDKIQGYQLMFAKRSMINSTVKDDGALHYYNKFRTGDDYNIDMRNRNTGGSTFTPRNTYASKPYNTINNSEGLNFDYVNVNYLTQIFYPTPMVVTEGTDSYPDDGLFSRIEYTSINLMNKGVSGGYDITAVIPKNTVKQITFIQRLYANTNDNTRTISNSYNDDTIELELNDIDNALSFADNNIYGVTFMALNADMYLNYNSQELVVCSQIYKKDYIQTMYGTGDSFIGYYGFRNITQYVDNSNKWAETTMFAQMIYSRSNVELRYGDEFVSYYPNMAHGQFTWDTWMLRTWSNFDSKLYNIDFNSLNDLVPGLVFHTDNQFISKFPYRYIVSDNVQTESLLNGWNVIKYYAYMDTDITKGYINSLNSNDLTLFVQKRDSLFVMQLRDDLHLSNENIGLQQSTVFNTALKEVVSVDNNGYIGSAEEYGNVVTKYGYCIFDTDKKKVFIVNGIEGKDITIGVADYFEKFTDVFNESQSNPVYSSGLVLGYNDIDEMLIIYFTSTGCQEDTHECDDPTSPRAKYFTLSFSFLNNGWLSFHNYAPSLIQHNRYHTFSIKNNIIYQHNDTTSVCTYYRNKSDINYVIHDDVVDYIFNSFLNDNGEYYGSNVIKIFNAFNIDADVVTINDDFIYDKQADELMAYNDTQCTGLIDITNNKNWFDNNGFRMINNVGHFNKLVDIVKNDRLKFLDDEFKLITDNLGGKNFFDMSKFISKFIVLRMVHKNDNKAIIERLYIMNVNVDNERIIKKTN